MSELSHALSPEALAKYIDHTVLRPEATEQEIATACEEAITCRFRTVCVEAKWLPLVASALKGSGVIPISVVGFPTGAPLSELKADEALAAMKAGAQEIDMVLNRAWLKERDYASVLDDMRRVVQAVPGIPVKVILETSELTDHEKVAACALASAAGASFVKTSTGFSKSGATESDVRLMRSIVGDRLGVKASGGIRSYEDAVRMIRAGASRLGTSASVAILKGAADHGGGY